MTYGNYPELNGVKKVLVIKLRQLGDVFLTTPVFSALKKRLPEAQIDAYVYTESFAMLRAHPAIDHLLGYDRKWKKENFFKRLFREWLVLRKIRKENYDLIINLTEGDRGAIAAKVSRAKIRVGFSSKGRWQKKLYTHIVKQCPTLRHTVERNLDALRRIGIFPKIDERSLFINIDEKAKVSVSKLIGEPFILIHPTSRWRFKCWPVEKMQQLASELIKRGKKVVITSGPDPLEVQMVEKIASNLDLLNLSGKITLEELKALIAKCELLVCVDSLPFHLANALKKKVVAIFGPTSNVTWGPWQNEHAQVVCQKISCRPCYQDGCGGSKVSDCLATLDLDCVVKAISKAKVIPEIDTFGLRIVDKHLSGAGK